FGDLGRLLFLIRRTLKMLGKVRNPPHLTNGRRTGTVKEPMSLHYVLRRCRSIGLVVLLNRCDNCTMCEGHELFSRHAPPVDVQLRCLVTAVNRRQDFDEGLVHQPPAVMIAESHTARTSACEWLSLYPS